MRTTSKFLLVILAVACGVWVYRSYLENKPLPLIDTSDTEFSTPLPPSADSPILTHVKVDDVIAVLDEMEIKFEQTIDNEGDPKLVFDIDEYRTSLFFYSCNAELECRSLLLYSAYSLTDGGSLENVNNWNQRKRFTRAFMEKDGDITLESDLQVEGGITPGAIKEFIFRFQRMLPEFLKHIGFIS